MVNCRPIYGIAAGLALCSLLASRAIGQGLHDLYRIQDAVSETHVEYHEVKVPAGKEVVLGDLKGPDKITYWYITDGSNGKFYAGLVLKIFWDGAPGRASTFRSPTSSGPWAAARSITSRFPCRSSISATCATCRCRFRSVPASSWPTTATRTIGRAWPGGWTRSTASSSRGRRAGCARGRRSAVSRRSGGKTNRGGLKTRASAQWHELRGSWRKAKKRSLSSLRLVTMGLVPMRLVVQRALKVEQCEQTRCPKRALRFSIGNRGFSYERKRGPVKHRGCHGKFLVEVHACVRNIRLLVSDLLLSSRK